MVKQKVFNCDAIKIATAIQNSVSEFNSDYIDSLQLSEHRMSSILEAVPEITEAVKKAIVEIIQRFAQEDTFFRQASPFLVLKVTEDKSDSIFGPGEYCVYFFEPRKSDVSNDNVRNFLRKGKYILAGSDLIQHLSKKNPEVFDNTNQTFYSLSEKKIYYLHRGKIVEKDECDICEGEILMCIRKIQ